MTPLFSVIIPTCNRVDLLMETLASIKAQTFRSFEIVVAEDAATDGTADRVAREHPDVKLVRLPGRSGVSGARNAAIRAAEGRYLAFLDDDDLLFPWTLATYAAAIEGHREPAFISSDGVPFRSTTELAGIKPESLAASPWPDYLRYRVSPGEKGWLIPSGVVVRRDAALSTTLFDRGLRVYEDEDFWLQLGDAAGFVRITAPLCWGYRTHASLSTRIDLRFAGAHALLGKERDHRYPGGASRRRERRAVIAGIVRHLARWAVREGRFREASRLYADLFAWNLSLGRAVFIALFPGEMALHWLRGAGRRRQLDAS